VYGVGALLHAMLVGEPPSTATAFPPIRGLSSQANAQRPSLRAPVHPAFDEVVLRALSNDPASRHASVGAFLAHVRWAAAQERGASGAHAEGHRRRALGVYVEVLTEAGTLDVSDTGLLEDFESILPVAREHLATSGLSLAVETGNGALFVTARPAEPARDKQACRDVLDAALSLHRRLANRTGRDPRIHVHLSVHAGELLTGDAGDPIGGELLELSAHIPENAGEGLFTSAPLLAGLDAAAQPSAQATLVRIA
jgi:serine/threonine-protein kinase